MNQSATIQSEWDVKKVLVTGANGFIGSHLIEHLLKKGVSVRCLVRKESNRRWLEGLDVEYTIGDITDRDSLIPVVSGVDVIFHLGGRIKSPDREGYFKANVVGTENLLETTIQFNPSLQRFVFISSQAAAGPSQNGDPVEESDTPRPVTPYGESKLEAEKIVAQFADRIPVTVIRPPIVFGPRDIDVYEFFKTIRWGIRPILGWRERYGSMIYVEDLIQGILLATESKVSLGKTYFLVTESGVSWKRFGSMIAKAMGKKAIPLHIPVFCFLLAVLLKEVGSKLSGKPSIINRSKIPEFMERFWICDGSKAVLELGFHPSNSLEEGILKTAAWYSKMGWI